MRVWEGAEHRDVATVTGALGFAGGTGGQPSAVLACGMEPMKLSHLAEIPAKALRTSPLAGRDAVGAWVTSSAAFLQSMREM